MKRLCSNCQRTKSVHEFQDGNNGDFVREFNVIPKTSETVFRCTVCGHEIKEGKKAAVVEKKES